MQLDEKSPISGLLCDPIYPKIKAIDSSRPSELEGKVVEADEYTVALNTLTEEDKKEISKRLAINIDQFPIIMSSLRTLVTD